MPFLKELTLCKTVRKSCCTLFGNHNIFIWITFDRAPKLNSVQSFILSTIVVGALNSKIESFHQQIVMHQLLCQSYCMHHKILNLIVVRLLKCFHWNDHLILHFKPSKLFIKMLYSTWDCNSSNSHIGSTFVLLVDTSPY